MYDPADELARQEEREEALIKKEEREDAEACDMVDAIMQGDFD